MCHPEVPEGVTPLDVERGEITIESTTGEQIPVLRCSTLGSGPAVVLAADIYGRSPFYEDLSARLAIAGFTAYLPDLFFRQGPLPERTYEHASARRQRLDDEQALRDLRSVVGVARTHGARVGTLGFCMGGTHVLLLAAAEPNLVTVCYYGFPNGTPGRTAPTPWSMLDQIRGPILGFWGSEDGAVESMDVEKFGLELRMRKAEIQFEIYPGLGHGFMAASGLDPSHPAYEVACETWTNAIALYRERLSSG